VAYVPKDAEWFLAELVEEIRVAGSKRNIVHINYIIIHARSPRTAFANAMALGKRANISYLNEMGKKVTKRFRGLRNLDGIYDPLGDGCEIMFEEKLGVSEKGMKNLLQARNQLEVFQPIHERRGRPNYSSMEIMNEVRKRLGGTNGD
jgi:hypothetical protein